MKNEIYDNGTSGGNARAFEFGAGFAVRVRGFLVCALLHCGAQSALVAGPYEFPQWDTESTAPRVNAYPASWTISFGDGDPNTAYWIEFGCGSTVGSERVAGPLQVVAAPDGSIASKVYVGGSSNDFFCWTGDHSEALAPPPDGTHYQIGKMYWARLTQSSGGAELDSHSIGVEFDIHVVWQGVIDSNQLFSCPAIEFTLYPAGVGGVPPEGRPSTGWEGYSPEDPVEYPELNGNTIRIPYMNESGENADLSLEIGGETYDMQVLPGLNILDWKIPTNWDGTYSLNGEEFDISTDAINLGTIEFPSWMHKPTEVTDYGSEYAIIKDSSGQTYHVPSSPPDDAIPEDSQGIINLDEAVKTPDGHGDDDAAASADAFADVIGEGGPEMDVFPDVSTSSETVVEGMAARFENFRPLSETGIPQASSMAVSFSAPFGGPAIGGSMDFSQTPFPQVRFALLLGSTLMITVAFLRKITI